MVVERARLLHNSGKTLPEIFTIFEEEDKQKAKSKRFDITLRTLQRYKKENKGGIWEVDESKKQIYDATLLVEKDKILSQFKPKAEQDVKALLEAEVLQKAKELSAIELAVQHEAKTNELKARQLQTFMLDKAIEIVKKGKVNEEEIESFEYEQNRLRTRTTTREKSLGLRDFDVIKLMQGLGILQTTPTVAIQNNNSAEAKVENKTIEGQIDKVKERADFQTYLKELQNGK